MVGTANFELAAGAITTARAALNALRWDEETTRFTNLRSKWFRCKMCAYGVPEMVYEDLVSTSQFVQPLGGTLWADRARAIAPPLPETPHTIRHACRRPPAPIQGPSLSTALGCRAQVGQAQLRGRAAPVCLRTLPVSQYSDGSGGRGDVGRSGEPKAYGLQQFAIPFSCKVWTTTLAL